MKLTRAQLAAALVVALAGLSGRRALAQAPDVRPAPSAPLPGDAEPPIPDDGVMPPDANGAQQAPPPADAVAPAAPPTPQSFDRALTPYGRWIVTPEYGRVWVPNESPGWQPYTDGRWVFTEAGWSFAASVPWGWATYHYGRWGFRAGLGWYWVPGYTWGPAWVSWRTSPGYVVWAPLAPRGYVYPPGWSGWVGVRAGAMTLSIRTNLLGRAYIGGVVRGARPGWAYAPVHLRPEYRMRYYRASTRPERRRGRRWEHR